MLSRPDRVGNRSRRNRVNEQYEMSAEDAAVRRYFEVVRGMHPGRELSAALDKVEADYFG